MTKVDGEPSTASEDEGADAADTLVRYTGPPVPPTDPPGHFLVRFWRSAVGKKWVMAVSGIVLLGYVLAHMVGNLKVFLGEEPHQRLRRVAARPRRAGVPAHRRAVGHAHRRSSPRSSFHILAAYQLTRMNHQARPVKYQSPRDYVAANFASRTMRWTGVIVALFVDLPPARPDVGHRPTPTSCAATSTTTCSPASSGCRWRSSTSSPTSRSAFHIFHGAWSMFQSLGLEQPALQHLAPLLRGRRSRRDHGRQREHAAARRHRGREPVSDESSERGDDGSLDAKVPAGPDRRASGTTTSST